MGKTLIKGASQEPLLPGNPRKPGLREAWKREAGLDRIETIAEIHEQHFLAGFHSKPLYTKLYNPRGPHIPEENSLEMRVDVERLRMEIALSQPAPPLQCDSSPRRLPVVIRGRMNPERRDGYPRLVRNQMNPEYRELILSQRRRKDLFLFKPMWIVFCP